MRELASRALLVLGAMLALALMLEGVLRQLPVQNGPNAALEHADPDVWFEPDRDFSYSRGWQLRGSNRLSTNGLGFVSAVDYSSEDPRPLVAVIGDSYVQALMIPSGQDLAARLRAQLSPNQRVYAFAASGAPLSQYLAFADLARRRFRPAALVVVIVGNDFDESLRSVRWEPGFHHFEPGAAGELQLARRPLPSSAFYSALRGSALVNYLFRNLEIRSLPQRLRALHGERVRYAGNTRAEAGPQRVAASLQVIDAFLAQLPEQSGLPPQRIVLVLDSLRRAIYEPERTQELAGSYFGVMRGELSERALRAGFAVLDTQDLFFQHYARHGERFEFPDDGHWNPLAHRLVANALAQRSWPRH